MISENLFHIPIDSLNARETTQKDSLTKNQVTGPSTVSHELSLKIHNAYQTYKLL